MNSKKLWSFLLSMAMLVQLWSAQPLLLQAEAKESLNYEQYRGGSEYRFEGTEDEYIILEISTEEDLEALAKNCELDAWSRDKKVILQQDIVLHTKNELCIPTFAGIFDGNGHSISNLTLTEVGSAVGLFRYVQSSGVIKNLTVQGVVAPLGSQDCVGGIVGSNYGILQNCEFSGSVTGDGEVGGIAGRNEASGEIRRCRSQAEVIGNHSTGGIAGENCGIINNCQNSGNINIYSTEVTYDLEDITVENLEQINSTANVAAHTDTGGIAGICEGKIYYCTNTGNVGYSHIGYNTGGIVGRLHQGYLQNCTNLGHIRGRKDVGGIAGQMEPFLEAEYLSTKLKDLDNETDKFLDLLDAAQGDLSSYSKQASAIAKDVSSNLKNANDAGSALGTSATDLWYIYNQELNGISSDWGSLSEDLQNQAEADKNNGNTHDITVSGNGIGGIGGNNGTGGSVSGNEAGTGGTGSTGSSGTGSSVSGNGIGGSVSGNGIGDITITVPNDTESYKAALRRFGDSASSHMSNAANASNDRTGSIQENLNLFNNSLETAFDLLGQLGDVLGDGTDNTTANVDGLMEQARVLRRLFSEIRDDLFRYEGISIEDTSDEAASQENVEPGDFQEIESEEKYDTSSFQKGKITLCINQGTIEADTNVGGITGQIATEYDFDPEDDITLTGTESFHVEQTIKAVVRDSRNYGEITGKKDYAGGIVGKAEYGAVISCESYAAVESTSGSYVGGIAGAAGYAVRSCSSMGKISGKNNIGGIVGEGCDIFYCYSYNDLEMSGESSGSIAGKVKEDGILYGNYYVEGGVGGVDGISYAQGAMPLSYEEFCSKEEVPEAFCKFTITFLADGEEIASYQCKYREALSQIPEVPQKEGCYGVWPAFDFSCITGNKVLEAEYVEWQTSIASKETSEDGKPLMMAEGEFYPNAQLQLEQEGDTYTVTIINSMEGNQEVSQEMTLRVYCEDADHTEIRTEDNGSYKKADSTVIGSYREFTMQVPGSVKVVQTKNNTLWRVLLIVFVIAAVGTGIFLILKKTGKKHKKKVKK